MKDAYERSSWILRLLRGIGRVAGHMAERMMS